MEKKDDAVGVNLMEQAFEQKAENDALNFDDIGLDAVSSDELAGLDLSGVGEVDQHIDFPHIKFSTSTLKDFLRVAKAFCAGKDAIAKSVAIFAENDKVVFRCTDYDVYFEFRAELLNIENVLTEPMVVPIDIINKLVKAVPINTVLYRKDDSVMIRLVGGDMPLDSFSIALDKFTFSDEVQQDMVLQPEDVFAILKDFSKVVTAAVAPNERRIVFEDSAYASYMWAVIKSQSMGVPMMDLKIKDIQILAPILNGYTSQLKVYSTTDKAKVKRRVIEGDNFRYAFLVSSEGLGEMLKGNVDTVADGTGVFVDLVHLFKLVELASDLPYSSGKVGLNYTADGDIAFVLKLKKGNDPVFTVTGSKTPGLEPLPSELVLQAKLLKILLRSFNGQSSVQLSVKAQGLGVKGGTYSSALFSESL